MKNLETNWIIYVYFLIQTPLAILRYTETIHWKWTYVMMPTWIILTIIFLIIFLTFVIDVEEKRWK